MILLLDFMVKIAIDVALLPSEKMMDEIMRANKKLLKTSKNKIELNKKDCLPHISLAMGIIEEKDLPKIKLILKEILKEFSRMELIAESVKIDPLSIGEDISSFKIKNISKLKELHKEIMSKLKNYLSYDVEKYMFYDKAHIDEGTIKWVKKYSTKHDDSNSFNPHITLGIGKLEGLKSPIKFKASKLALCQLGIYCTCRKVLFLTELR